MASEFLKKKAREQAESNQERSGEDAHRGTVIRGGQTETKEDGNQPSSTRTDRYESSYASDFLKKKAEEQAAGITKQFGEDAYGGTKWRSENSALSDDALEGLLRRVQGLETPGSSDDALKTSGGFYRRQTTQSEDAEDVYGKVSYLSGALREYALPLESATSDLQRAESNLKIIDSYLKRAQEGYASAPTQQNADVFNQIAAAYDQAYKVYTDRYDTYSDALTKYKAMEDRVGEIVSAYQQYTGTQKAAFDDWRGTIRDAATVKAEIEAIDRQMAQLEAAEKAAAEAAQPQKLAEYQAQQQAKPWYEKLGEYLGGVQDTSLPMAGVTSDTVDAAFTKTASPEMQRLIAMKELLQEELDWSQYYYYADFANAADFGEKSRYMTTANGREPAMNNLSGMYTETGFDDLTYDYINRNEEARGRASVNSIANNTALLGLDTSYLEHMTDEEISIFNYLYATQGADAAYQYTKYLTGDLNRRQRMEQEAHWAKYAQEDPLGSSVFSVMISPTKGLSYLGQAADMLSDGEIDQNAAYNKFSYIPATIREKVPENWGAVGTFAYQTGMSMADFLTNTAITGNNQAITLAIMGSGAAADATLEAKARGLSDDQAFTLGTIAGILEGGIEAANMETVLKPDALKDGVIRYILKNATAEGLEEAATDVGNLVFDVLIAADQNVLKTSYDNYRQEGLTDGGAIARTFVDQVLQMGSDFLGGFVSGGIMSGTNAGVHVNYTNQMGSELGKLNLDENDIQTFIETGLESDPDTASYQLAEQMQEKIEAGEELSNYDLARLYQANVQAVQAEEDAGNMQDDTAEELEDAAAGEDTQAQEEELESISLKTLDDEVGGEVSAETMRRQAQADYRAGEITETEFDEIMDDVMHLEELEDGTSVKTFDSQADIHEQTDNVNANVNGGIPYENTDGRTAGPATAQFAGELDISGGANISGGSSQRYDGAGAGVQAGGMAGRARQTTQRRGLTTDQLRTQNRRNNIGKNLRTPKVSSISLGINSGTETENLQEIPQEYWDEGMTAKADQIHEETGKPVRYVLGKIQVKGANGGPVNVKGVYTGESIIIQANNFAYTAEQIADHEGYHGLADAYKETGLNLNRELVARIKEQFTKGELEEVLQKYVMALRETIDAAGAEDGAEYKRRLSLVYEELLADARAGMNMFNSGVTQFTNTVNQFLDEKHISRRTEQDNGTRQTNGPNETAPLEKTAKFSLEGNAAMEAEDGAELGLRRMIDRVKEGDFLPNEIVKLGTVSDFAADWIKRITGIDTTGYKVAIEARQIKHILNDHGESGKTDRSMADVNDLTRMGDVLSFPDDIRNAGTTKAYRTIENGEVKHQKTVLYEKQEGEKSYYVVQAVANTKKETLYVVTAFRGKPGYKNGALQVADAQDPGATPKSEAASTPNEIMPQDRRNVKERFSFAGENASETVQEEELKGLSLPTLEPQEDAAGYDGKTMTTENGALPFKTGTREGYPGGNTPSSPSIPDHQWEVKRQSENERFSLDDEGDGAYSAENKIYPGMDDVTRAEVLQKKEIRVPAYNGMNPVNGADIIRLKGKYASEANQILRTLAKNCGAVDRWYYNADVDLDFRYTMKSVRESINKQAVRGGGAEDFGKMLTVLPEVCDGAAEIEAHTDKYTGTKRMDPNLKAVHVLLGAFSDGDALIPIQLEIKEYKPGTQRDNKLYITVTVKNEAGISSRANAASWASTRIRNTPASAFSIAEILGGVKDETGDLVKYFPDSMLNDSQLQAKKGAIQKDNARLEDMRYENAVSSGDTDAAEQMLQRKAAAQGYTASEDWRARHRAPNSRDGISVCITDLDGAYGGDGSIYSPFAETYYGEGRSYDWKALRVLQSVRDNPEAKVTVYRAVPKSIQDTRLRNGDWVTQTAEYARAHGKSELEGDYRIISQKVPAKYLYANGDSIHELGYDNGNANELYKNAPNNVKLAQVTYDDSGNLIPLSKRYDTGNTDIRYSVEEEGPPQDRERGTRENMTTKEREILRGAETNLLRNVGKALSVTKFGDRSYLKSVIQSLSDTYLESGTIEQQAMDDLFEQAYRQGIVVDRELHDQYEEVRKYLHTVSITLDPRNRSDIADYPDLVKRMRGMIRIVNEGGRPVDSAWQELNDMAPELFPDSIAHPADQLVRMAEALKSLRITEKSLSDYYGPMASTYKKYSKAEFERAVWDSIGELRQIRRYEQERQQKLQKAEPAPATPEEAMEAWAKLKTARKTYEKAMAKNLLTTVDEIAVGELLKGKMLPEHLDKDKYNIKGVLAVYEAKQEYEHLTKLLAEYRRKVKADIRAEADTYLETANEWKDKAVGLLYSREIMQRNVEDIVPDRKLAKRINERYFEPVRDAEAAAVKLKEEYREAVRKLSLSRNVQKGNLVSEAHAVQLYGEAMDNIRILEKARGRLKHRDGKSLEEWRGVVYKLWQENPGLDKTKIENAVSEMRRVYDELFQKMNEVRVQWGYEPVNYRQGYFPHFQPGDGDGIMAQFGRALGIDTQVVALPTTINGLTHTFKPGIQWFGNAQERLGFNTAYDVVEGFDRYIEGVASVICQTENIQRLRALASQIRYRTSDEGIRKQVDAIYSNPTLTEEQKNDAISGIYEKGRYTLSNFVVELDEYTNLLANKKSKLDRTVEALIGRKFYTAMKWLESRVGANMIAGNVTSALTNFIPLTQASAQLSKKAMLRGMWDTLVSYKTDDGIVDRSSFLTNRKGSDPLVKVWSEKVSEVLGKPMELIDSFTAGSIVRAAYHQNMKQGLSESEAMHQADIFASRVMAERSKGGMPTLFESKNPFFKLFTQFQLEVNNQWSEVFKDIPRSQREKGLGALALVFLQYFLGAWLFNNLYEKWIGRRPAMDPIDIVLDTVKDFASEDVSATDALGNLANNIVEELPFSSAFTLLGAETDGGRLPVSSAIPNIPTIVNAATNKDWAPEKRWKEAQDELNKLAYVIPPFGGNQVSKIWKGAKAYIEGGSYSVDSDGNDILQYPVYNDENGDFWGLVQAMLLGKSALPEAREWVEDGFNSLSAKQTAIYQDMINAGVSEREAYDLIDSLRSATETDEVPKEKVQVGILQDADATDECKAIAFYGLLATKNERMLMDSLTDAGALPGVVMNTLIQLRDAAALPAAEEKAAQADILVGSALTESEKEIIIRSWLDDQEVNEGGNLTNLGKFNLAMKQGFTTDEYLQFRATGKDIDKLLEYTAAGFETDEAQDLQQALDELEPLPNKSTVSNLQKWRASVDFSDDVEDQLTALSMIMKPKQLAVWETANDYGVAPDVYVTFQEIATKYDANGNGSYTQEEAKAAIDAEFSYLTTAQKAVLWQWVCYSSGSKTNPYDPTVGQKFIDSRDAAKVAAEE